LRLDEGVRARRVPDPAADRELSSAPLKALMSASATWSTCVSQEQFENIRIMTCDPANSGNGIQRYEENDMASHFTVFS
jgi:hypothetical protein